MQRPNTQEQKIQRWIALGQNYSGFNMFNGGGLDVEGFAIPKINYDPSITEQKREWEFRIGIKPTPENLQNALRPLGEVFKQEKYSKIDFKCFVISNDDLDVVMRSWDGTKATPGKDRDQRGKEICVYMAYDPVNNRYQLSPDQYKELMLEIWKKLYDAKIEGIGYAAIPAGDKAVTSIGLLTPFTYTAFKPYQNAHGILFQTNPNPYHHDDPLQGVIITQKDLEKANIPLSASDDIARQRTAFLTEHYTESQQILKQRLEELKSQISRERPINTLIYLIDAVKNSEHPAKETAKLSEIIRLIPFNCDQNLSHPFKPALDTCIQRGNDKMCLDILADIRKHINSDREKDIRTIRYDFMPDTNPLTDNSSENAIQQYEEQNRMKKLILQFLVEEKILTKDDQFPNLIDENQLTSLIDSHPQEMQNLYRILVHHLREYQAIEKQLYFHENQSNLEQLNKLITIILDTEFWNTGTESKPKIPTGIPLMQKRIKDFYSSGVEVTPDTITTLTDDLKKIAEERSAQIQVPLFRVRDDKTKLLYSALKEMDSDKFEKLEWLWRWTQNNPEPKSGPASP